VFAVVAIPALVFAFTAHRYIKIAFFLAGGGSLGYAFYVFSPMIFKKTAICCGANGTQLGHIGISAGVGLIGGLIALKILKLGVFLIGAAIGIIGGIGMMFIPAIANLEFFEEQYALPVYYGSFGFVFGVIAIFCKEKTLVFSSAVSGSFLFLLGVDYFAKTSFNTVVKSTFVGLEQDLKQQFDGNMNYTLSIAAPENRNAYIMLGVWVLLLFVTMTTQFCMIAKNNRAKKNKDDEPRSRRSDYELRETRFRPRREESDLVQSLRSKYSSPARGAGGSRWRSARGANDNLGVSLLPATAFELNSDQPQDQSWPYQSSA